MNEIWEKTENTLKKNWTSELTKVIIGKINFDGEKDEEKK